MKKLFVKATMKTHLRVPDLSGEPGFSGIQFPLKATFCEEDLFTVDEIRDRVERAVEAWGNEVAALGGDDSRRIVTDAMKYPGEHWFNQNGIEVDPGIVVDPMQFCTDGMLYVEWYSESYIIAVYGENPYMEAGEIISASAADGEKVFVTACQGEEELSFEACTVKEKKAFYDRFVKELSERVYIPRPFDRLLNDDEKC